MHKKFKLLKKIVYIVYIWLECTATDSTYHNIQPIIMFSQKGSLHRFLGRPLGPFPTPSPVSTFSATLAFLFSTFSFQHSLLPTFFSTGSSLSLSLTVLFLTWSSLDTPVIFLSTLISVACSLDFRIHVSHPYVSVGITTASYTVAFASLLTSLLSCTFSLPPLLALSFQFFFPPPPPFFHPHTA